MVREEAVFSKSLDSRVERALEECLESAADVRRETAGEGGAGRDEVRDSRCGADSEEVERVRVVTGADGMGPVDRRVGEFWTGVIGVGVTGVETGSAAFKDGGRVGVASPSRTGRWTALAGLGASMFCIDFDALSAAGWDSCEGSSGGVKKAELGEGNGEPAVDRRLAEMVVRCGRSGTEK